MKSPIWTIFRKEVLENLRDRKTVMNALIVSPLLGPLLCSVLISTVMTRELGRAEKPLELPVIGAEMAPNLVAFIGTRNIKIEIWNFSFGFSTKLWYFCCTSVSTRLSNSTR